MATTTSLDRPALVSSYTVCLLVVGVLALIIGFSHQMFVTLMPQQGNAQIVIAVLRLCQAIEIIVFVTATTAGVLRAKATELALPTTAAASILLAFWPPIGTAVFVWWMLSIRKKERTAASISR